MGLHPESRSMASKSNSLPAQVVVRKHQIDPSKAGLEGATCIADAEGHCAIALLVANA